MALGVAVAAATLLGGTGGYAIRAMTSVQPPTVHYPIQSHRGESIPVVLPKGADVAPSPFPMETIDPNGDVIPY